MVRKILLGVAAVLLMAAGPYSAWIRKASATTTSNAQMTVGKSAFARVDCTIGTTWAPADFYATVGLADAGCAVQGDGGFPCPVHRGALGPFLAQLTGSQSVVAVGSMDGGTLTCVGFTAQ